MADIVDNACPLNAVDHHKQPRQQRQRLIVDGLHHIRRHVRRQASPDGFQNQPHQKEGHADHAVGDFRLIRDKGGGNQGSHRSQQQPGRQIVCYRCQLCAVELSLLLSEEKQHHRHRHQRADLHDPEHTGPSLIGEEVHKIQSHMPGQQDGRGIAHQRGGSLQIGADGNGQNRRHWGNLQLFGNGHSHRGQHQHSGHIVHKGGHKARKQCQRNDEPLDAGQQGNQTV